MGSLNFALSWRRMSRDNINMADVVRPNFIHTIHIYYTERTFFLMVGNYVRIQM